MDHAKLKRLTVQGFKNSCIGALQKGEKLEPGTIAIPKGLATALLKADGDSAASRIREFIASTADVDRDGDTVAVEGWELEPFRKSGSFLWAHDYDVAPIARALACYAQDGGLRLRVEFPDKDMGHNYGAGFGHAVMRMFDEKLLKGVSVGFIPKEWAFNEDRSGFAPVDFKRQELLEVSATPVPANPNALAVARAKGIDTKTVVGWVEAARDKGAGLWVPSETLTALLDSATTSESSSASPAAAKAAPQTAEQPAAKAEGDDAYAKAFKALEEAETKLVDELMKGCERLQKQGRVLSASNEARLRSARDLLSEVISQVEDAPEIETDAVDSEDDDVPDDAVTVEQFHAMAKDVVEAATKKLLGRLPD